MGEKTNRAKVSVALIGVGSSWELYYRNAIERLSSKLSIRAVCDSVQLRAASVADEFEATAVSCPWQLTQRTDLHAWLILDPGWYHTYPAELAVHHARPALYANTFAPPLNDLTQILKRSLERGETLMPEFPQRFTPATTRLRELIATRLGPVRRIEITIPRTTEFTSIDCWLNHNQESFVGLVDWCSCLIGSACDRVAVGAAGSPLQVELNFRPRATAVGNPAIVSVNFEGSCESQIVRRVECERGNVIMNSPTQIGWYADTASGDETLSHERSPHEIILDQFCRRALGGLVPVPTLGDALQAITITQLTVQAALARRS